MRSSNSCCLRPNLKNLKLKMTFYRLKVSVTMTFSEEEGGRRNSFEEDSTKSIHGFSFL